jgi:hypothetical protein
VALQEKLGGAGASAGAAGPAKTAAERAAEDRMLAALAADPAVNFEEPPSGAAGTVIDTVIDTLGPALSAKAGAKLAAFDAKLAGWVAGKMAQYDAELNFRERQVAKYGGRRGYEASLRLSGPSAAVKRASRFPM